MGRGMAGLRMDDGFLYVSRWCRMMSLGPGGMRASLSALHRHREGESEWQQEGRVMTV